MRLYGKRVWIGEELYEIQKCHDATVDDVGPQHGPPYLPCTTVFSHFVQGNMFWRLLAPTMQDNSSRCLGTMDRWQAGCRPTAMSELGTAWYIVPVGAY